jgi:hypothetical protein
MPRILAAGRKGWLPGAAVLGAAVGIGALLGTSLGADSWLLDVALIVVLVAGLAAWGRWRASPAAPAGGKGRGRLRALGRKPAAYDLASDESTKNQRYLM